MATNYDFTLSYDGVSTAFVLTSSSGTNISFNSVSSTDPNIVNYYSTGGVYGYGNQAGLGGNPSYAYADFIVSVPNGNDLAYVRFIGSNTLNATTGGQGSISAYSSLSDAQIETSSLGSVIVDSATIVQQSSSVAPEMNASFIPQVALMLACLFFLLGRKRETVEPMLAV